MGILIYHFIKEDNLVKSNYLYGNKCVSGTKYGCVNTFYFLSLSTYIYSIAIDCVVGSPNHGTYLVNWVEILDKKN